jgi:hypothetical protein
MLQEITKIFISTTPTVAELKALIKDIVNFAKASEITKKYDEHFANSEEMISWIIRKEHFQLMLDYSDTYDYYMLHILAKDSSGNYISEDSIGGIFTYQEMESLQVIMEAIINEATGQYAKILKAIKGEEKNGNEPELAKS